MNAISTTVMLVKPQKLPRMLGLVLNRFEQCRIRRNPESIIEEVTDSEMNRLGNTDW